MSGNESGAAAVTEPGRLVGGRYRLTRPLGSGGFGSVWQARDEVLGVDVAVKEVRLPPAASAEEQTERLLRAQREARHAARLRDHPNVVGVHDVVVEGGAPWTVMQLIVGHSLEEQIVRHGPLAPAHAARVGAAVLTALGAAHQAGIVHRDVKPANILLADDGRVLLADFGIAVQQEDTALTASGMFIGSVEYLAPERAHGRPAGPESDLFALGATLYFAVEGRSPFRRDTAAATLTAVLFDSPEPPARAGALAPLISGLLTKDPAQRLTGPQAAALLSPPATAPPIPPVPPPGQPPYIPTAPAAAPPFPRAGGPRPRRSRLLGTALAAVALLLLCAVALPLRGPTLHVFLGGSDQRASGVPVYEALGLDRFLKLGQPWIVLPWPWLLTSVSALVLGAVLTRHRHLALRLPAFALALALPARMLATDLTLRPGDLYHGLPPSLLATASVSFGPGWWLLHLAAVVPLALLVLHALRSRDEN